MPWPGACPIRTSGAPCPQPGKMSEAQPSFPARPGKEGADRRPSGRQVSCGAWGGAEQGGSEATEWQAGLSERASEGGDVPLLNSHFILFLHRTLGLYIGLPGPAPIRCPIIPCPIYSIYLYLIQGGLITYVTYIYYIC